MRPPREGFAAELSSLQVWVGGHKEWLAYERAPIAHIGTGMCTSAFTAIFARCMSLGQSRGELSLHIEGWDVSSSAIEEGTREVICNKACDFSARVGPYSLNP